MDMQIIIYITDGGNYMIIFFRKYKSKIALMVFICALVCTVSCLLDFKTLEKQKMPGLEKKSVFMGMIAISALVWMTGCAGRAVESSDIETCLLYTSPSPRD